MSTIAPIDYILEYLKTSTIDSEDRKRYEKRIQSDLLTRQENSFSHFCSMFIPYDEANRKVLLVHHKKAQSWVFPGGHMEYGESPTETALREATEELGLRKKDVHLEGPISLQVCDINNPVQICREHFDLFFILYVNLHNVKVDRVEVFNSAWITVEDAGSIITLNYYKKALKRFKKYVEYI
ncbi:MAG TPA: NUDIX domain-containing protein [Candidatus Nitrosocosmicus sp.]|nr:NUDIX domain-containing protein [Candidatus Nitrosocosmicus sp.]